MRLEKSLSAILAALLLLPVLASCSGDTPGTADDTTPALTAAPETTPAVTEETTTARKDAKDNLPADLSFGGETVLRLFADFLDPFARAFGLDGNVLSGFILSLPANEIALPIMAMGYSGGGLAELGSLSETAALFSANGFSETTALCTIIFFLFHWPCATTIITVWKETKSIKWTALSVAVPLLTGLSLCFIINIVAKLLMP